MKIYLIHEELRIGDQDEEHNFYAFTTLEKAEVCSRKLDFALIDEIELDKVCEDR